ncbi:hypothetical protein [Bradyrhizobium sp. AUGA SZCCT0431]|uniref:hypothetical protein n=1 Tax=Bradyrhizobium sp. AUGA SZCCT0431 TaxID=2807674 RepID=UPI001BA6C5CD|nr:hypothetical protein [Bradyrhizobium sp. AUGA SZCCT0431]MBR1145078.1 hypothetical protein [Bradyrhizobium sp. AUGA SZCCT0431]
MTNPVLQALSNAKVAERVDAWQRNEAAMLAALKRQFGELPAQQTPARAVALSAFIHWCEAKGVRSCPAQPAVIAQFSLENASLGIDAISEAIDHIAAMHEAAGLANPVATWIVAEALDGIGGDTEAPRSWPKEHKWRFTQLPCVLRRYVAQHERQREKVVRQAHNDAAVAKRQLADIQKPAEAAHGNQTAAA